DWEILVRLLRVVSRTRVRTSLYGTARHPGHFSTAAILKDLRCVEEMASGVGFSALAGQMTYDAFMEPYDRGFGDQDFSSVYAALKHGAPPPGGSPHGPLP
ncbi:MAG: hypothetical protein OEM41_05070, partial [Ignavibacteria bacterium]|nr:hypothetical protein [Ignavibacteria bacterium]